MPTMTWDELIALAPMLAGKRISVEESGWSTMGTVIAVDVTETYCTIRYTPDFESEPESQGFSRDWGSASLHDDHIRISISMIGGSKIYL